MKTISESDWKIFKRLRAVALERLSQRILDESRAICDKTAVSAHDTYLELYQHIQRRDKQIASAFNHFSRSSALLSLRLIRSLDLLTANEISEFSESAQQATDPGR